MMYGKADQGSRGYLQLVHNFELRTHELRINETSDRLKDGLDHNLSFF